MNALRAHEPASPSPGRQTPSPARRTPMEPQAQRTVAAWGADRASPTASGTIWARTAAVKRQMDRLKYSSRGHREMTAFIVRRGSNGHRGDAHGLSAGGGERAME